MKSATRTGMAHEATEVLGIFAEESSENKHERHFLVRFETSGSGCRGLGIRIGLRVSRLIGTCRF